MKGKEEIVEGKSRKFDAGAFVKLLLYSASHPQRFTMKERLTINISIKCGNLKAEIYFH